MLIWNLILKRSAKKLFALTKENSNIKIFLRTQIVTWRVFIYPFKCTDVFENFWRPMLSRTQFSFEQHVKTSQTSFMYEKYAFAYCVIPFTTDWKGELIFILNMSSFLRE